MSTPPAPFSNIETLEFETDAGLGRLARIGLIILQTDQTIEQEFRQLVPDDGIALYHARIPNMMEVSPKNLRQMQNDLPETAKLLPPSFEFNAVGFACTSGATMIGEDLVDQMIRSIHPQTKTSNPITACKAALKALGLRRMALVTPYPPQVTLEMQANLRLAGFDIIAMRSFNQSDDFTVARISSASILKAILAVGAREEVDGVFVSCTSLRALEIIPEAEVRIGKPVISSNQALAWHLLRLAEQTNQNPGFGRLFSTA